MKTITRRRILSGALACAALTGDMTRTECARADLFGGDLPLLSGILVQSIMQVSNLASMLTQIFNEVRLMTTMLKAIGSGSFPALVQFIGTARTSYNTLTSGVRSMTYSLGRIDSEYQQLFPSNQPAAGTTVAQHAQTYQAWHQEIVGAAQVAARQQTDLATLDQHVQQTQSILQQSQSEDGVVGQLQLIAQMIGITNAQLTLINQTLSTTGRVLTDMAAGGASEQQLSLAKKGDHRAGYTDKGPTVTVPTSWP
jgi:conjugal transfer/entry exclusion protein